MRAGRKPVCMCVMCMVVCVERIQRSKTRTVEGEGIQHFLPMIYISYMCALLISEAGIGFRKDKENDDL